MHERFFLILLDVLWYLPEPQSPFQRTWVYLASLTLEPAGFVSFLNILLLNT